MISCVGFDEPLTEEYKNRLERIVDEILETKVHNYAPPFICFSEQNQEKQNALLKIFTKHCKLKSLFHL